jgi:hypothetical protein
MLNIVVAVGVSIFVGVVVLLLFVVVDLSPGPCCAPWSAEAGS